jgi:hypothetical protein
LWSNNCEGDPQSPDHQSPKHIASLQVPSIRIIKNTYRKNSNIKITVVNTILPDYYFPSLYQWNMQINEGTKSV